MREVFFDNPSHTLPLKGEGKYKHSLRSENYSIPGKRSYSNSPLKMWVKTENNLRPQIHLAMNVEIYFPLLSKEGVRGRSPYSKCSKIFCTTPSKLSRISRFVNLRILTPVDSIYNCLTSSVSFELSKKWDGPSTSIARRTRGQKKSTLYSPTPNCLRNL